MHGTLADCLMQQSVSVRTIPQESEHGDLQVSAPTFAVPLLCPTSHTLPGSDPGALCSQQNFYIYTGLFMIYKER